MPVIDEVGRRAGRRLLEEAATLVDLDEGLEQITSARGAVSLSAAGGGGERGGRLAGRWWMAVAAAAIIAVVVATVIVATRGSESPERLVTEIPPGSTMGEAPASPVRFVPSLAGVVTIDIDEPASMAAAVSPNGEWVAYQGPDRSVCLASLTGAGTSWCRAIPDFGFRQLSWSPDSSRFTGGDEAQLGRATRTSVVELDGTWSTLDVDLDRPLIQTTFALDGASIVGVTPGATNTDVARLVVVDADTGATRVLADAPGRPGAFGDPFPIDPARSVFFAAGATADNPDAVPAVYVLDHRDGTVEQITVPFDATLMRVPIGVTSTEPPVVLMSKSAPRR